MTLRVQLLQQQVILCLLRVCAVSIISGAKADIANIAASSSAGVVLVVEV